jgi:hypothetical protein
MNVMGRTCIKYGETRGAYRLLMGKPEGKTQLGRPRRRGKDNIKWIRERLDKETYTEYIWLRIGTCGRLL